MLKLKTEQREVLVEKLPDMANLVVGALFLGQFLGERPFSFALALSGIAAWIAFMIFTLIVAGGDDQS